ncbi:hypothetical protein [Aquimarina sp. 2304DJ70-9]|uniref:hypothetical protein n=1 Tax=Aquimarina penaris TaxID=3231044 RepID=UPI003461D1E1
MAQNKTKRQTNFDKKLQSVLRVLENNHDLTQKQLGWIREQRYRYNKRHITKLLSDKSLKKLDALTPLLGYPWYESRTSTAYTRHQVFKIKQLLSEKKPIPNTYNEWLIMIKRKYQRNPSAISKQNIQLVDSLIPFLGYDWKQSKTTRKFIDYIQPIRRYIKEGHKLTNQQKWSIQIFMETLGYSRSERIPEKSSEITSLLDQITNDFRGLECRNALKFVTVTDTIYNLLQEKRKLTPAHSVWFLEQRKKLSHTTTSRLTKWQIKKLDDATVKLNYDWRIGKTRTIFDQNYLDVINTISQGISLKEPQKQWIHSQAYRFKIQHHLNISEDELAKMYHLQEVLKDSWEILSKTGDTTKRENKDKRNQIERWIMSNYHFLNLSAIERELGIPKGTLQKFYKYDRKLDYKWIDLISEFARSISFKLK